MKSAFLTTVTMLTGIASVFGTPVTASNGPASTTTTPQNATSTGKPTSQSFTVFQSIPGSDLAKLSSSNNTAPISGGPGPVQRFLCYATDPSTLLIGVGHGIDQEGAEEAAINNCGDNCFVHDCGEQPTCFAFATGAAEIGSSDQVVLVVHRVNADSQKAAVAAENFAVKECSTLIHGNCSSLGHTCL